MTSDDDVTLLCPHEYSIEWDGHWPGRLRVVPVDGGPDLTRVELTNGRTVEMTDEELTAILRSEGVTMPGLQAG